MTKQEVKDWAKTYGMKVRESFMDDAAENCAIAAVFLAIGYALGKFF